MLFEDKPTGQFIINMEKLVNVAKAKRDAQKLFEVTEDQLGTDEEEMIRIFALPEVYQSRATYDEYVKVKCLETFILLMNEHTMETLYIKAFVMYGASENFGLLVDRIPLEVSDIRNSLSYTCLSISFLAMFLGWINTCTCTVCQSAVAMYQYKGR